VESGFVAATTVVPGQRTGTIVGRARLVGVSPKDEFVLTLAVGSGSYQLYTLRGSALPINLPIATGTYRVSVAGASAAPHNSERTIPLHCQISAGRLGVRPGCDRAD